VPGLIRQFMEWRDNLPPEQRPEDTTENFEKWAATPGMVPHSERTFARADVLFRKSSSLSPLSPTKPVLSTSSRPPCCRRNIRPAP
jgi:hypothetical protein